MKIKTQDLTGAALNWAVAKCEGVTVLPKKRVGCYVTLDRGKTVLLQYSADWAQGGPIIERAGITVATTDSKAIDHNGNSWCAYFLGTLFDDNEGFYRRGTTPLVAAMRCYVASKLGDEVEIPEGL